MVYEKSTKQQSKRTQKEHLQQDFYSEEQQVLGSLMAFICRMWRHSAAINVKSKASMYKWNNDCCSDRIIKHTLGLL